MPDLASVPLNMAAFATQPQWIPDSADDAFTDIRRVRSIRLTVVGAVPITVTISDKSTGSPSDGPCEILSAELEGGSITVLNLGFEPIQGMNWVASLATADSHVVAVVQYA